MKKRNVAKIFHNQKVAWLTNSRLYFDIVGWKSMQISSKRIGYYTEIQIVKVTEEEHLCIYEHILKKLYLKINYLSYGYVPINLNNPRKIDRPGNSAEINDSFFSKQKYNREQIFAQ